MTQLLAPNCVVAAYKPQHLPSYKGNPLIEALPKTLNEEELFSALHVSPSFDVEQRTWSVEDRLHMLESLRTFLIPLARHVELARSLDSMMRAGYVGRAPQTEEHARRQQSIYEDRHRGNACPEKLLQTHGQNSMLLMGLSGMGKTTTVKQLFSHIPQVIYHPELHIYQVTHLHVEMPSDGSSIKGLAHGILNGLDKLIPGADYYTTYALKGRPGADALMRSVARLLSVHHVGFLVADEIQNLANAYKGKQTVMTELVSACNELGVPILFIGTNKAAKVFSLDFRQSRRASGRGAEWGPLMPAEDLDSVDEWGDFLSVLWTYQWVRKPVALDAHFLELMHHYSCGVIDVAIKLFAAMQARAMLDGSETLTPALLSDVYKKEMFLLHPMLEAMRKSDFNALAAFEDIAPLSLTTMLEDAARKVRAKASPAFRARGAEAGFEQCVATALVAGGVNPEDAVAVAAEVALDNSVHTPAAGIKQCLVKLSTPHRTHSKKNPKKQEDESVHAARIETLLERPKSYENAIVRAKQSGLTVLEELTSLGMTRPLDEVFELN